MSRPKNSPSGNRRSATSVHRFVRMRFLYFTNIGFDYWHFTALARSSHHQEIKIYFRYSRSSTIISHRSPSFTSIGVLQALAYPKFSNKFQLCRENKTFEFTSSFPSDSRIHRSTEMASSNLRTLDYSIGLSMSIG